MIAFIIFNTIAFVALLLINQWLKHERHVFINRNGYNGSLVFMQTTTPSLIFGAIAGVVVVTGISNAITPAFVFTDSYLFLLVGIPVLIGTLIGTSLALIYKMLSFEKSITLAAATRELEQGNLGLPVPIQEHRSERPALPAPDHSEADGFAFDPSRFK